MNTVQLVAVVAVIIVVVGGAALLNERRKANKAKQWAKDEGWSYTRADQSLLEQLPAPPFDEGSKRFLLNVVEGPRGSRTAFSAEYVYVTESLDRDDRTRRTQHHIEVAGLWLSRPRSEITVRPRGALGRAAVRAVKNEPVTGDKQFDEVFVVTDAQPEVIEKLLTASVRRYCLAHPERPFAITEELAITWKNGKRNLKTVEGKFDYLDGLVQRLPAPSRT